MSTCISSHGEYGSHEIPSDLGEFVCDRCAAFDESAALAALARARFDLDHTAALERERIAKWHDAQAALWEPSRANHRALARRGISLTEGETMRVAHSLSANQIRAGAHNAPALATTREDRADV